MELTVRATRKKEVVSEGSPIRNAIGTVAAHPTVPGTMVTSSRKRPTVLFDLGHPADVHLFKNLIWSLPGRGFRVVLAARLRDNMEELLQRYRFCYYHLGHYHTVAGKALGFFSISFRLWRLCCRLRPDVLISFGSPYTHQVAFWSGCPAVCIADTEPRPGTLFSWQYRVLFQPFVRKMFVPRSYCYRLHIPQVVRFKGTKELAYLAPAYFRPDAEIMKRVRPPGGRPLVLVKFSANNAIHDIGYRGFRDDGERVALVRRLEALGAHVLVSSERPIPTLAEQTLRLPAGDVHHVLAFCDLYLGEGATMAAEAGVLGVPWIFLYSHVLGYLREQAEVYGLGWHVTSVQEALQRAAAVLKTANRHCLWQQKRARYLAEAQDLNQLLLDEIYNQLQHKGAGNGM